jgi:chaperonin GroEL (HSP60 family)
VFDDGSIYMALVDGTIETERDLIKLLEFCKKTMRPMIIVAQDFSSEALTAMVVNRL